MQQLLFIEPGRVEWDDVPAPVIADPTDALVRPIAVATCDIDTALMDGSAPFPGPFPLGHEGIAEVVEVGTDVTSLTVGQRVVVPFQISCGNCSRCRRGRTASCERVNFGAMYGLEPFGGPWGGFLTDLVRVPWADHMLVPLPDGVDPVSVASLSDNIVDGWRTVAPYVIDPTVTSVLVIGQRAPSIPYYSIAVAKALGVEQVDYLSWEGTGDELPGARAQPVDPKEKAARLGARVLAGPDEISHADYTITVCSANDGTALKKALRATEPDGVCVVNSVFFEDDVPVPMFTLYTRGIVMVTGRVSARDAIPRVLPLITDGRLEPATVTDAVVDWSAAAESLVASRQKLVFRRA